MTTRRFSTFEGVFTPCLLSILGVIMYLRLGYVVGSIGLGGTILIICLANIITFITALSMSSVVTNIRIGAGGAYSIITKSLGLEAGSAIGIPLYISQAVSIAFYITGFAEGWAFLFPQHDPFLISLAAWIGILAVSYASAKLAFQIQYLVMAVIVASIVSICMGKGMQVMPAGAWERFSFQGFWPSFAIFFPAVTGILAGASMSGELKDPRVSIPKGTVWAIIVSFGVYLFLAYWFYRQVPLSDLRTNTSIAMDLGRWPSLVIAGIMGATLSSALAMAVGSPRILQALGKHSILPFSSFFSFVNKRGEPAAAILFTAVISLITIIFGTLDQIAVLLTMIFLITYGMINMTVFIEESIGIASFRPTFRIARIFPFIGTIGCLGVMFLIDQRFGMIAFALIIGIYLFLIRKSSGVYAPDVRSGILVYLAERFAEAANRLPYYPKIWKPNLVVPVRSLNNFSRYVSFIQSVIAPAGRVTFFKVLGPEEQHKNIKDNLRNKMNESIHLLREKGLFVETAVIEAQEILSGTVTIMQTVNGLFFPPNTLFYILENGSDDIYGDNLIIKEAAKEGLGIIILKFNEKLGFSQEKAVNLWIRRHTPNINLAILIALQIENNWQGQVRVIQVVDIEQDKEDAIAYLNKLKTLMRMPVDVDVEVMVGPFMQCIMEAPPADVNIFGMGESLDVTQIFKVSEAIQTSVLFLRDSKHESALA